MADELNGMRVAILVDTGFEQVELTEPKRALEQAGARTFVVSPRQGQVRAWNESDWGIDVAVDVELESANAGEFDALLLPGGVMNPDFLRINETAVRFVRAFIDTSKPVAAICHGPWMLVEANVVAGRKLTSWPSLRTDIRNAGGDWIDQQVVIDQGLVTSRHPGDLPQFCQSMIDQFQVVVQPSHHRPGY
jgi:protease I